MLALGSLFSQSGTPAHEMILPPFSVGLPTSTQSKISLPEAGLCNTVKLMAVNYYAASPHTHRVSPVLLWLASRTFSHSIETEL